MLDFSGCHLTQLSIHRVGNKTHDEELRLSGTPLDVSDRELRNVLIKYFLTPFEETEFYHFTASNDDFRLNPLYNFVSGMFENADTFHDHSINIARHLYEKATHPNIKSGDLFVTKFEDMILDDMRTEVIGIFKAENIQSFLKLNLQTNTFTIDYDDGINVEKLDKGCLVFNLGQSDGYRISIVDKSNRFTEAQYWRDVFLDLKPCSDEFHQTKAFLNMAKSYIMKQLDEEFEIEKADKIDLLNRSMHYFKNHEAFNQEEFEADVFYDDKVIASFRKYNDTYNGTEDVYIDPSFDISPQAVKRQERVFKSVLKLDKNFHIYIHGDRNMIERGTDADGRKYYKIYYDREQ